MSEINVIDRLFTALETGDSAEAGMCFTPDGALWHSFDGVVMTPDQVKASWEGMAKNFSKRVVTDVRRQPTPSGFVQQHLMVFTTADGTRKAWPVCVVVRISDGLISRLDEYVDRAGSFDPGNGELVTPGMD